MLPMHEFYLVVTFLCVWVYLSGMAVVLLAGLCAEFNGRELYIKN